MGTDVLPDSKSGPETTLWGEFTARRSRHHPECVNPYGVEVAGEPLIPRAHRRLHVSVGVSHLYTNVFGMPARRSAALVGAATVLAAGALVGATAAPANADGGSTGSASAVNARLSLDLSLLQGSVNVPVKQTLNAVTAPGSSEETVLAVGINGYNGGAPFTFVSADVAKARATVDAEKAEGHAELTDAVVKLPGVVPSLLSADVLSATATCAVGKTPVAKTTVPASVVVLGQRVTLDASGETNVDVPGVGKVKLVFSEETVTSDTAAATALKLNVVVNPLKLNIAKVEGEVVLSEAKCETPAAEATGGSTAGSGGETSGSDGGETAGSNGGDTDGGSTAGSAGSNGSTAGSTSGSSNGATAGSNGSGSSGGNEPSTQTGGGDLAETGAGNTLALGGVAAALIAGGGVALWMRRRGSASRG